MMKKIILAAMLFAIATTGAFAFGIGLQYNGDASQDEYASGLAVTFKTDSIPLVFAVSWSFVEDATSIGITGDYWFLNDKITNVGSASLNWFVGVGFFADFYFPDDEFVFMGGVRIPVGLNMYAFKGQFEPFLMIAPSFGLQFVPTLDNTDLFFPISLGFRFWFK